jgi:predicted RNA binding protein YcfA (HicA-like mRNA interferase family)
VKFRDFIPILEANGFALDRQGATSHRQYRGTVGGKVMLVTVDYSQLGEDISKRNLASMIRQSGLPKKTFRR